MFCFQDSVWPFLQKRGENTKKGNITPSHMLIAQPLRPALRYWSSIHTKIPASGIFALEGLTTNLAIRCYITILLCVALWLWTAKLQASIDRQSIKDDGFTSVSICERDADSHPAVFLVHTSATYDGVNLTIRFRHKKCDIKDINIKRPFVQNIARSAWQKRGEKIPKEGIFPCFTYWNLLIPLLNEWKREWNLLFCRDRL